jgi:hypothetical protein
VDVLVWVSGWQMQCCGEPFGVGDRVERTLDDRPDLSRLEPQLGAEVVRCIAYAEDPDRCGAPAGRRPAEQWSGVRPP